MISIFPFFPILSYSFLFSRPTPSRWLFSACLLELFPRPGRGMCRCAVGLQLRVWRRSACFPSCRVALFRDRSFAFTARLVMRCGSDCPVPCDLSWLLDCLGSSVARFLLKRFNGFDVPVSRSSESHPSFRAICLRLALHSVLRPALRLAFLSSVRPVLPCVMSSTPCPIAPRAVRFAVINRPALLVGWLGAGRDEPSSSSPARLAAVACLLWACGACVCSNCGGLLCLLWCRRLCLYCDGEIVYMICPAAII